MKPIDWAALTGMVTGVSAITLSIANYLRDRPCVKLTLQWDQYAVQLFQGEPMLHPFDDPKKLWGLVTVTNTGRRPIYVSHVCLRLPGGKPRPSLVLRDGLRGQQLGEGDPPLGYPIEQADLVKHAKYWRKIRAEVIDSTGKRWRSKATRRWVAPPSWAKAE
jgi:hypothetical protein